MSSRLSDERWAQVVRDAPLVSIDLIVVHRGCVLLGWRNNLPARHCWFVPGGVIRKGESMVQAFARISEAELGQPFALADSHPLGVYEHFYDSNFLADPSFGTHYVVLAHRLEVDALQHLPDQQHSRYCWLSEQELLAHEQVHRYVKRYFNQ